MRKVTGTLTIIGLALMIFMIFLSVSRWLDFKRGYGDYLKLAGDASTVEKADLYLGKALTYIEENGLTSGDTGIVFHNLPKNNLAVWYDLLKDAKENTLGSVLAYESKPGEDPNILQLNKSNALMKLRELLLDESQVTTPSNIVWYPNQGLMCLGWCVSGILFVVFGLWWLILSA